MHAPAPAVGSPTEEPEATGRGAGDQAHGASAPAARATVAESLADIRADRIMADARREAQAIVDSARVDARREARVIVDSARSEAETIITEAFEQRARIVRRDWAIGDGSWSLAGAEDEGDRRTTRGRPATRPLPLPSRPPGCRRRRRACRSRWPMPRTTTDDAHAAQTVPDVAPHIRCRTSPHDSPRRTSPHDRARTSPLRPCPPLRHAVARSRAPRPGSRAPPAPDVAAAAKLSELIELPALRARDRIAPAPPRPDPPHEPRPPLPARPRRGAPPLPRSSPPAPPPPPPPPAPPAPARTLHRGPDPGSSASCRRGCASRPMSRTGTTTTTAKTAS